MGWFEDAFSSLGDIFGSGAQAAGDVAEAAPSVIGDFGEGGGYSGEGMGELFGGGGAAYDGAGSFGNFDWGNLFDQSGGTGGYGDFGDGGGYAGGGGMLGDPGAGTAPVVDSAARGTGGPTAGALAGPSGPTEVGYAPGMDANGPTTPGNPVGVDQAAQYVTGQNAPPPPQGGGDFFDKALSQVKNNPLAALGVGGAAIGTGMQLLKGPSGYEKELQDMVAQSRARGENIAGQGNALLAPLTTGAPLPAGAQAQITQAQRSREAAVRSRAAQTGTLNSTMADSGIAQAREQAVADDFSARAGLARTGSDLLNAGLREIGGAESGYGQLMKQQIADDQQFQEALASLSASLGRFGNNQPQQPRYYR